MRVVTGEHRGLSDRWRHGRARLSPRHLSLRRNLWQFRFVQPFTAAVEVEVLSIAAEGRQTKATEMWSISPGLRVLSVETSTATLLWAVPQALTDWAISQVA